MLFSAKQLMKSLQNRVLEMNGRKEDTPIEPENRGLNAIQKFVIIIAILVMLIFVVLK